LSVFNKKAHAYLDGKDVTDQNPAYYGPAGGMLMNAKDLLTWAQALLHQGKYCLKNHLKELMTTQ